LFQFRFSFVSIVWTVLAIQVVLTVFVTLESPTKQRRHNRWRRQGVMGSKTSPSWWNFHVL